MNLNDNQVIKSKKALQIAINTSQGATYQGQNGQDSSFLNNIIGTLLAHVIA